MDWTRYAVVIEETNRIVDVGLREADADRIVSRFNGLMEGNKHAIKTPITWAIAEPELQGQLQ